MSQNFGNKISVQIISNREYHNWLENKHYINPTVYMYVVKLVKCIFIENVSEISK